jgi:Tfp pilus assembly pilus retraction ATPase PilT
MLKERKFTDLYVGSTSALVCGTGDGHDPSPLGEDYASEIEALRHLCADELRDKGREDFVVRHDGVGYRVSVIRSLTETVFVLRRFPDQIIPIERLGINRKLMEMLMAKDLSGLVVVSGAFGNGKTTTASSIVAGRLKALGGIAVTIEDPPEMPLEGRHGEGVCYQTWAEKGGFAEACRRATRWAPSMILLGEVRDPETAVQALRASVNGRLVVCTTHADDVPGAIERLQSLASGGGITSDDASQLLSAGLAAVLNQKIEDSGDRKQLFIKSLWIRGAADEDGIRAMINKRSFSHLRTYIDQQRNQMLAQGGNRVLAS